MRRLLPLLLLTAACDNGLEPDVFKSDQPRVRRLLAWDGVPVAEADHFYHLDPDQEQVIPLQIPGLDSIHQLGMRGMTPLAYGLKGSRRVLVERKGVDWKVIPLPSDWGSTQRPSLLAADASSLVLWSGTTCIRRKDAEDWKAVDFPLLPGLKDIRWEPQHAVLLRDLLVLGYDHGEWGGVLATLDLAKGSVMAVDQSLPVKQLAVDAKARIWAAQGLNHLSDGQGILRVLDQGAWTVFCQVGNGGRPPLNWTLPPMSFDALDVDAQGHPWILGSGIGLARWDGRNWSMATRDWPRHTFNGELYKVSASGLRLLGEDSALVAMGDAGIALWNWRRGRVRRISLKP